MYVVSVINDEAVSGNDLKVNIPNGSGINKSIDILADNDALRPAWMFKIAATFASTKFDKTIKAGIHKFPVGITNIELLRALFTGDYLYYKRITFPEGIGLKRFASIAQRRLNLDSSKFMQLAFSDSICSARGIQAKSLEGYLHPATYSFDLDINELQLIDVLLDAHNKVWKDKFEAKANAVNKDRHTILTIASIIEAESPISDERPRVSGVYWNRIARGMFLQADPTVLYAVGEQRRVLYADLKIDNPYNTYKYAGLPPGPINSPSISSIQSAIEPEKHNYLFFVAIGDGSMRHNFAKNFDEHRRFVRSFRENIKKGK